MTINSVAGQLGIIFWNLSNEFWRSGSLFHVTCACSITDNDLQKKVHALPQPTQEEEGIGYGWDGFAAGTLGVDSNSLHQEHICCH